MSDTEMLIKEVENLPPGYIQEILNFSCYLRQKYVQGQKTANIDGDCPLEHTPNAETIAAFEEGDAMLRGEIPSAVSFDPAKYTTKEELKAALMEALLG
jgi:hypothetical protein